MIIQGQKTYPESRNASVYDYALLFVGVPVKKLKCRRPKGLWGQKK
jgi:hypothetical protein